MFNLQEYESLLTLKFERCEPGKWILTIQKKVVLEHWLNSKKIPLEIQKGFSILLRNDLLIIRHYLLSRQHLYNQDTGIYCKGNE